MTGGAIQYSLFNKFDYSARFGQGNGQTYNCDTSVYTVTWATPLTGASSLFKSGPGTLVLPTANTYTGTTTISAGTVSLAVAETPGVSGPLGDQPATAAGSILMTGGFIQITAVNQFDYTGRFSSAGNQTWGIDTNGFDWTLNASLTGTNSFLVKGGAGTLTINAPESYDGGSTVVGGTLKLNNSAALGAGTASAQVLSGATLDLNGQNITIPYPLNISGTGVSGAGALTNSSATAATYAGLLSLSANASIVSSAGSILLPATGTITGFGFPLTLTLDGTATGSSLAGALGTGSGGLTKAGAGTWTVSGDNTFTGPVSITAGVLATPNIKASGAPQGLGEGTAITLDGGTLRFTNSTGSSANWAPTITLGGVGGTIDICGSFVDFGGDIEGGNLTVINSTNADGAWLRVTSSSPSSLGNDRHRQRRRHPGRHSASLDARPALWASSPYPSMSAEY